MRRFTIIYCNFAIKLTANCKPVILAGKLRIVNCKMSIYTLKCVVSTVKCSLFYS